MYKFLFLLLLFLDGFAKIGSSSSDFNQNAMITFEVPVVEVFELNASGENVVDSVRDYYNDGTLVYQMVYYTDGTTWMSTDAIDIKDLKVRQAYVEFKNSHDIVAYGYYKRQAEGINHLLPRTNQLGDYANYLYFNAHLDAIGMTPFVNYTEYVNTIGEAKLDTERELKLKDLTTIGILMGVILLIVGFLLWRIHPLLSKSPNTS